MESFCLVFNSHSSWRTSLQPPPMEAVGVQASWQSCSSKPWGKHQQNLIWSSPGSGKPWGQRSSQDSFLGLCSAKMDQSQHIQFIIFSFSSCQGTQIHSSCFGEGLVFLHFSLRLSEVSTRLRAAISRHQDLPYLWRSKCRAPRRPAVPAPHSCGTHFLTNLCNLPHHST